jgi:uncharacterized membrane protein
MVDTFTVMSGLTALAFIYIGERFRAGAYLWLGMLFTIIFALRMAETLFYISTAGVIAVLAWRTFYGSEDVRSAENQQSDRSKD